VEKNKARNTEILEVSVISLEKYLKSNTKMPKRSYGGKSQSSKRVRKRSPVAQRRSGPYHPRPMLEKKGLDTDVSYTPIISTTNTNGGIFPLNLIQPGTGSWNRVGRKVHLQSIRVVGVLYGSIRPDGAGVIRNNNVRLILVWDKQPSGGAIPTFDNVFGVTDQVGAESCPDYTCPPRYDNMNRFKVLKDWNLDLKAEFINPTGATPDYKPIAMIDTYVKLKGLETVFSGQSNPCTIADISSGALYLIQRAHTNAASISLVESNLITRLRYVE